MKVSIITVTHNSEKTISHTCESVLRQFYSDIEYIIIDGCSTDKTVEIISEYEIIFNGRMKWVSETDNGIYDAMNKGIQMASGEVIGLLNSDDYYSSRRVVSQIISELKNSKMDSVFSDVKYVHPSNLSKTVRYYSSKIFSLKHFKYGLMPAHPTFFTYRENYSKYGYYKTDYRIAADFELLLRFLYINKLSYRYLPVDTITMRTGGTSTSSIHSNFVINEEIVRACAENGIQTNILFVYLKYFLKVFEYIRV